MPCVELCKRTAGNKCRCKEIWEWQRQTYMEDWKQQYLHKKGICICEDICIYPPNVKWTTEEEKERMLESVSEQEFYNFCARYTERIQQMKSKAYSALNKDEQYYWVRATFRKDQDLDKIGDIIKRLIKLKPLKDIVCNVEFWSDDGKNFNPHSHMLIPKTIKKSKLLKDISRVFMVPLNMIEARIIKEDAYEEKLNYIKGLKQKKKTMNVEKDKESRKKYNIPDIYNAS